MVLAPGRIGEDDRGVDRVVALGNTVAVTSNSSSTTDLAGRFPPSTTGATSHRDPADPAARPGRRVGRDDGRPPPGPFSVHVAERIPITGGSLGGRGNLAPAPGVFCCAMTTGGTDAGRGQFRRVLPQRAGAADAVRVRTSAT